MSKHDPFRAGYRAGYGLYTGQNPYCPTRRFLDHVEWKRGYDSGFAELEREERERARRAARSPAAILDDEPALNDDTRELLKRICEKLELE